MNLNKCKRCGCFFMNDGDTCSSCTLKDNSEISKLNNFFEDNNDVIDNNSVTINELSYKTGITSNNLSRFINYNDFNFKKQIKL